jgi:hypothetical protein
MAKKRQFLEHHLRLNDQTLFIAKCTIFTVNKTRCSSAQEIST